MSKTNTTAATTSSRKRYSQEYKSEAMKLADRLGVGVAAKQLGIDPSQLYAWCGKAKREQDRSEIEQQLLAENARLKRQLAEQAEELAITKMAAAYFARHLK